MWRAKPSCFPDCYTAYLGTRTRPVGYEGWCVLGAHGRCGLDDDLQASRLHSLRGRDEIAEAKFVEHGLAAKGASIWLTFCVNHCVCLVSTFWQHKLSFLNSSPVTGCCCCQVLGAKPGLLHFDCAILPWAAASRAGCASRIWTHDPCFFLDPGVGYAG